MCGGTKAALGRVFELFWEIRGTMELDQGSGIEVAIVLSL
jgi:hypothetical protein